MGPVVRGKDKQKVDDDENGSAASDGFMQAALVSDRKEAQRPRFAA
jgi:hypothetical protein